MKKRRLNIDLDGIARKVMSETDRRKAYEATTPRWVFRHDWHDGARTFTDLRAGEIGVVTYDGPTKPKMIYGNTTYGTPAQGARLLRWPVAADLKQLEALDQAMANLRAERRELLAAAWWRGQPVTAEQVLEADAHRRAARVPE